MYSDASRQAFYLYQGVGVIEYDYTENIAQSGQKTGHGKIIVLPPPDQYAAQSTSFITYSPDANAQVFFDHDSSIQVTATVNRADRPDCTRSSTPAICDLGKVGIETNPNHQGYKEAYLDVILTVQIVQEARLQLRVFFRINSDPANSTGTLAIDHIEVVQVDQDHDNNQHLVAGKATAVRVFLQSKGNNAKDITSGISGTLTADEFKTAAPRYANNANAMAPASVPDQNNPRHSMNFTLPAAWTFPSSAASGGSTPPPGGMLHLHAKVSLNNGPETEVLQAVTFEQPPTWPATFRVRYIEVCAPDQNGVRQCGNAPPDDIASDLMQRLYPVSDSGGLDYGWQFGPQLEWPQYLGFSSYNGNDEAQAAAAAKQRKAAVKEQIRLTKVLLVYYFLLEHQLDQLFAWFPPVGHFGLIDFPDLSTANGSLQPSGFGHIWWNIGCAPADCAQDAKYFRRVVPEGLSFNLGLSLDNGDLGPGGFDPRTGLVIPAGTADLTDDGAWLRAQQYQKLYQSPVQPPKPAPVGQAPRASGATGDYLILGGTVGNNGPSQLEPGIRMNSAVAGDPSDPNGTHCLRFDGAAGADYCFTPLLFGSGQDGTFVVKVPVPAGATSVSLMENGGAVLTAMTAASGPPTLQITSPETGDSWEGKNTIQWVGSDPDGNPLTYTVEYSPDNGASWIPLSAGFEDTQYTLDGAQIVGGAQVLVRVLASNGLLTTAATVGPVTVIQNPRPSTDGTSLDFGGVMVGGYAEAQVTVSNTGTGPAMFALQPPAGAFSVVSPGAASLVVRAGLQRAITVRFAPAASGSQQAALVLSRTDATQPDIKIALTGLGSDTPVPNISVPTAFDFGPVNTAQPAFGKVTISNGGSAPLLVTALSAAPSQFTVTVPAVSAASPLSIDPGASSDINVKFAPVSAVTLAGTLTIGSNDPTRATVTVKLSGTGVGAPVTSTCLTPPANLVSWWAGDGNATDLTGGNNGTVQGGTSYAAGEVGQAFQFDGSTGYVTAGNPANLRLTSAITIDAWINPRSLKTGALAAIATKWAQDFTDTANSDSYGLWLISNNGAINLFSAIHQSGAAEPHVQGGTIALNAWTHVAMTFDSASGLYVLYVNGQAVTSINTPGSIFPTNHNVFLGREDSSQPRPFDGLIDEVQIVNRALTASEIQAIYNAGSAGECKPATSSIPAIGVSAPSLDFGNVTVGQTPSPTMTVTLTNKGAGTLMVSSLTPPGGAFTLVSPPAAPFNVPAAGIPITVRFTPTAAGAQKATLTINSNDPNNASVPVSLTGTGVAPAGGGVETTQLAVDDGTFETIAGFPNGTAAAYFVNRLTPPAYPATLRSVEIVFFNQPTGLQKGAALNILSGANPGGSINIDNLTLASTASSVAGTDQFNSFKVTPITIQSGDFVVGFSAANPVNFYLMAVDTSSASKQRSYISTDGRSFTPVDFVPAIAGNFGIRATVDVGGSAVAGPKITTSAPNLDFTSSPLGQPKDITLTITNTGGGTLSVSALPPLSAPFSLVSAPSAPFNVPAAGVPITVRYLPTTAGTQTGTLTIVSNDSTGDPARATLQIPLTGTGTSTGSSGGTGSLDTSNPLSTNLVALFAMNEGAGTTDKNLADGQLANFSGASPPVFNASDPSIVFKGGVPLNSYVNAGTDPIFDKLPVSQMTIVARVFANTVTAAGICEKDDGNSADGIVFGSNGTGGGLQLTVEMSDRNMRVQSVGAITAGKWIQVAVTWDGSKGTGNAADAHLFANGVELAKVVNNSGSGTLGYAGATNQPFRIGTAAFDFPGSFDGKMQYLAVYKGRILTPAELKQLDAKLPVK